MSTLYLFQGGGFVTANSPQEFTKKMRESSFQRGIDINTYRATVAERCNIYSGCYIRSQTDAEFLEDLIKNDFVVSIER